MPEYRVIIAGGNTDPDTPPGTYVNAGSMDTADRIDTYTTTNPVAAWELRDRMERLYPRIRYVVVGGTSDDWDAIARAYSARPTTTTTPDHDDIDDEDDEDTGMWCAHCGEDDHDEDSHLFYECEDCGWGCGVPDCDECLHYSDEYGGELCDDCYESHEHRYGSGPGEAVRTHACCGTADVHHDDVTEVFLCDCEAARRIAAKYPVRLAYELPTLEVA